MYILICRLVSQCELLLCKAFFWCGLVRFFLLLILVGSLLAACSSRETLWSTSARSPSGLWIAEAHTYGYGGPGNAAVLSSVDLRRINVSESPGFVLAFSAGPGVDLCPRLKWRSPTELEVIFRTKPEFDTQVIKYAGINIAVRVVPSESDKGKQNQPKGVGNVCEIVQ